jgi:RNA polymerase sigma factor (sigma-70 family)
LSCNCHPDLNQAISAHQHHIGRSLGTPGRADWDDLLSDGHVALWKALESFDADRGDLDSWLSHRVRFRMIDGIRSRAGRGHTKTPTVTSLDDHNHVPAASAWDDLIDALDAIRDVDQLMDRAAAIDPRLPHILRALAHGHTRTEAGGTIGISRTRVYQLISQLTPRASA